MRRVVVSSVGAHRRSSGRAETRPKALEQIGVQQRLEPLGLALRDVDASASAGKQPRSLCTDKKN
jgi:hypothetical protein